MQHGKVVKLYRKTQELFKKNLISLGYLSPGIELSAHGKVNLLEIKLIGELRPLYVSLDVKKQINFKSIKIITC